MSVFDPALNATPLETLTTVTLLGIRFWDAAYDRAVTDALAVSAHAEDVTAPAVKAFRTPSGIYAFQGLPGLRDLENGAVASLASPPPTYQFRIEVIDLQRRFLPTLFRVNLPLPYRGVFPTGDDLAERGLPGLYLYSAPTRTFVTGMALVRARLRDQTTGEPAAFALLTVRHQDDEWQGIATETGEVLVGFPFPTMSVTMGGSPPGQLQTALEHQEWPLIIEVAYEPDRLDFPAGAAAPDLRTILEQAPALIWPSVGAEPIEQLAAVLTYNRELILRTDDLSELRIERTASPPSG